MVDTERGDAKLWIQKGCGDKVVQCKTKTL